MRRRLCYVGAMIRFRCFVRHGAELLLLRRPGGSWGVPSGAGEEPIGDEEPKELLSRLGLNGAHLSTGGEPHQITNGSGRRYQAFLYDAPRRELEEREGSLEARWLAAPELLLLRDSVSDLWDSYRTVAPSLSQVRADRDHGSSWISLRALEVLRDEAVDLGRAGAEPEDAEKKLVGLAEDLRNTHPSMSAVSNRLHRAFATARERTGQNNFAIDLAAAAQATLSEVMDHELAAAGEAASLVRGRSVLTLSRSESVSQALLLGSPASRVFVAESRPGGEGEVVARELARRGLDTTLVADAAMGRVLADGRVDLVLVGADAILADGTVANKCGTRLAALAAKSLAVPVYVVAASDKISPSLSIDLEGDRCDGGKESWSSGPRSFRPLFELTPAELISKIVTEEGPVEPSDLAPLCAEAERLEQLSGLSTLR